MKYLLLMGLLLGCGKSDFLYKKSDCIWRDRGDGKNIYQVVGFAYPEGSPSYLVAHLDIEYKYGVRLYGLMGASYVDDHHPSLTHEQECANFNDEAEKRCLKDKNFQMTTGGMKCPSKQEYEATK